MIRISELRGFVDLWEAQGLVAWATARLVYRLWRGRMTERSLHLDGPRWEALTRRRRLRRLLSRPKESPVYVEASSNTHSNDPHTSSASVASSTLLSRAPSRSSSMSFSSSASPSVILVSNSRSSIVSPSESL
jgi:hypothetical protein